MDSRQIVSRGALIVVEGLDRAGKTSQCHLLLEALRQRGHAVKYIRFPDRSTPTGEMIDGYLKGRTLQDDHSIHLLFSANRWEAAQGMESDLLDGMTIIVDRYSYSGAVYSAAKNNPNLSLEWAWHPEVGLPRPDLLLFLSLSPETATRRGGFGEERYEDKVMQSRVRNLFDYLIEMDHGHDLRIVEAGLAKDQVANEVLSLSLELLSAQRTSSPIQKLRSWRDLQNNLKHH